MATMLWAYARIPFYLGSSLAAFAGGGLYYYQNEIIYPRNLPPGARTEVPRPPQFRIENYEELMLPTPDGETISAFLIKPDNNSRARPVTIINFHGNAGNAGHRLPIAKVLANDIRCTTLMVEYRGYGLSTGTPNEKGLAIDAQTALDYVRSREDLKHNKIVVYGQSLGGAVSIDLVAKNKGTGDIKGLVLENTFLSIAKMIPSVMPIARFLTPLCHEYWRSEDMIPQITDIPVLFISGLQDEMVPPAHMKELLRLCKSKTVVWKELPYGDHNNSVTEPGYFSYIDDFITKHVSR
ncbi:bem46 protein, variant [Friedmanniomyces endolithicus]|uniref:Bem46 protein, variant n=1 Tax=Friedmanniomyces endolithicus TaxID=329885 RepID=A0A4U0UKW1_9PEZI|nr:bem46 protein, variant [Friedmanniomyces endolithicus]KAK0282782.1 bem46 protein, variant [Friedmanniomyces endolithicus]KAK0297164.1 bem46 protein, variant [Friedmanniomyces endolithicus]KAK0320630.1 bem46 protein, variant [Friedmanniomyces endolithicus]KAK0928034.1 bem46 protein, variant [Friedmanniomyces endolithicus]